MDVLESQELRNRKALQEAVGRELPAKTRKSVSQGFGRSQTPKNVHRDIHYSGAIEINARCGTQSDNTDHK